MNAYSLDLRKKVVEAKQRGTPTSKVGRSFGVGISTIKRYAAKAREGRSLDPKKRMGTNVSLSPLYAWAQGRACSVQRAARSGEERHAFGEHDLRRDGAVHRAVVGSTTGAAFEA